VSHLPFSYKGLKMPINNEDSVDMLSLTVNARILPLFFQLLGHGFFIVVQTGSSVKELLCNQLGIQEDYLEQRIQSIFLNGKVVDDVNTAIVNEDATMALSGAMPGLAGAILRTGGYYAPMRSQISHQKNSILSQITKGKIILKLWNLVVKELGPTFLQQGILLQGEELQSFFERHREALETGCQTAEMMGKIIATDQLSDLTLKSDPIFLQVKSEGSK
jgi:hypothetical protein